MSAARAAAMAAEWWAERLIVGDREKFKAHLRPAIEAEIVDCGTSVTTVDYDPQGIVLEAVRAAGVECRGVMCSADGILPRKTGLIVTPVELRPKEGYANWTARIPVLPDGLT
jgi:hypothetical protein